MPNNKRRVLKACSKVLLQAERSSFSSMKSLKLPYFQTAKKNFNNTLNKACQERLRPAPTKETQLAFVSKFEPRGQLKREKVIKLGNLL